MSSRNLAEQLLEEALLLWLFVLVHSVDRRRAGSDRRSRRQVLSAASAAVMLTARLLLTELAAHGLSFGDFSFVGSLFGRSVDRSEAGQIEGRVGFSWRPVFGLCVDAATLDE